MRTAGCPEPSPLVAVPPAARVEAAMAASPENPAAAGTEILRIKTSTPDGAVCMIHAHYPGEILSVSRRLRKYKSGLKYGDL